MFRCNPVTGVQIHRRQSMFRKLVVYTSLHDITLIHQLINDVYLNSIVRVYCYSYAVTLCGTFTQKTWSRTSLIENKYNQCVNATRSLNSEYEHNKWKDRYTRCSILFPNYSQSCAKYALIRKDDRINS